MHQVPHLQGDRGRGGPGHRHDADDPPAPPRLVPPLPARPAGVPPRHADADRLAERQDACCPRCSTATRRKQIEAIWVFLSDGTNAAEPYGLGREPIPLVPRSEAILYRNFIEGAGPRAIGVGYPEKANLAFDANDLRLALIWQGAFIDASRHWTGRGDGFQAPLGDNVLTLPAGPELRRPARTPTDALARRAREGARRRVPRLPPDAGRPADVPLRRRRRPGRGLPRRRRRRSEGRHAPPDA